MNKYGKRAQEYWTKFRPRATAEMNDPTTFFEILGDQVQERVLSLSDSLAGPDPAGEGYLEKVGRLNAARSQAEEIAMAELVYSQPTEDETPSDPPSEVDQMLTQAWRAAREALDE